MERVKRFAFIVVATCLGSLLGNGISLWYVKTPEQPESTSAEQRIHEFVQELSRQRKEALDARPVQKKAREDFDWGLH